MANTDLTRARRLLAELKRRHCIVYAYNGTYTLSMPKRRIREIEATYNESRRMCNEITREIAAQELEVRRLALQGPWKVAKSAEAGTWKCVSNLGIRWFRGPRAKARAVAWAERQNAKERKEGGQVNDKQTAVELRMRPYYHLRWKDAQLRPALVFVTCRRSGRIYYRLNSPNGPSYSVAAEYMRESMRRPTLMEAITDNRLERPTMKWTRRKFDDNSGHWYVYEGRLLESLIEPDAWGGYERGRCRWGVWRTRRHVNWEPGGDDGTLASGYCCTLGQAKDRAVRAMVALLRAETRKLEGRT